MAKPQDRPRRALTARRAGELIATVAKDLTIEVLRSKALTLAAKDQTDYIAKVGAVYTQMVSDVTKTIDSVRP